MHYRAAGERASSKDLETHLVACVRKALNDFLSQHPKVGIMGLARLSGVSHMSIRRILNTSSQSRPSAANVFKLFGAITGERDLHRLISKSPAPVASLLAEAFPRQNTQSSFEILSSDREAFIAHVLCSVPGGASISEVTQALGSDARSVILHLARVQIVTRLPSGRYQSRELPLSAELIRKHLCDFVSPKVVK